MLNIAGRSPQENYLPSSTLVIVSSSLLAIALYVVFIIATKGKEGRQRSAPPGPPGLPLLGNLLSLHPQLHTHFARLTQTYGPIFQLRFGNKLAVVVSSPALAKEVLRDNDVVFANRDVPAVGLLISYGGCNIVSSPYGALWRMLRRVCVQEMLSRASMESVYSLRRSEVRGAVGRLYANANAAGTAVNVGEEMFLVMMNVITSMLWGGTVLDGEERRGVRAEFRKVVSQITEMLSKPNISDFFPVLAPLDLQGMERKMRRLFLKFDGLFEGIIDRRVRMNSSSSEGGKDFLQFLLRIKEERDAEMPMTMAHLKALLMVISPSSL